jgi:hypothetical protein
VRRSRLLRRALMVLGGAVGLAIGVLAVLALREATLSTHERVAAGSTVELVVQASEHGGETNQTLAEMVEAQVGTCRLEVASDVVGEIEDQGGGRFRATLSPALDETNRRQFRGCIEDWVIDHVRMDVVRLAVPGEDD